MAVVTARDSWNLVTQEKNMKKGPLVRVELQPGRFVKMYEADAIAAGHIAPPEDEGPSTKSRPKPEDKQVKPQTDKGSQEDAGPEQETKALDDFTTIDGVGPATARALAANGMTTFDELREAGELDFLSASVNASIEEWRDGG